VTARASFPALGTTAVVAVTDAAALADARSLLARELAALDRACSRFRPDSELSRANARAGRAVEVGPLLAEAVAAALDAARLTGGLVDPTLGSELRRAGYDRPFELVRARAGWRLEPGARRRSPWREVELDRERGLLRVPRGSELDLGATAKAFAADRAAALIARRSGAGVLVSLGGDIAVAGDAPSGGWCVQIADDHAAPLDRAGHRVAIRSGGLATSSTTVRRWRTSRGEAHHLLDPATGAPAVTPWRTVSVAAVACLDANVASTAAVVLGSGAAAWLRARLLPARLVDRDGGVVRVGGWPAEPEAAAA
jgi:thiamine biosynthesis lipoprotein